MVSSHTSVLGMKWLTITDSLSFRWRVVLTATSHEDLPTKRELLRIAMSVFDPLGLVAFLTVLPRIILRDVWRSGTGWDELIPEECKVPWLEWLKCLEELATKKIPRWTGNLGH